MFFKRKTQGGFLLLSAIILSVIVGLMAVTVAYLYTSSGHATANQVMTTQAFYIAQAGIEQGLNAVATRASAVSARVACASASGSSTGLGAGSFTVTGTQYTPAETTLSAAITAAANLIPLTSVSGYAPSGTVLVDREFIDYGSLGTTAATCSPVAAPCLLGAVRGEGDTTAATHNSGAALRQNLCLISSTGVVNNAGISVASRTLTQKVQFAQPILVGNADTAEFIATWNGNQWVRQAAGGGIANHNLNGMSTPDFWSGWGAGALLTSGCTSGTNRGFYIAYSGATTAWSQGACSTNVNVALNGVYCLNSSFCKAVGATRTFAGWNGSAWSTDSVQTSGGSGIPNVSINEVYCTSSSNCVAVGNASGGPVIATWTGGKWTLVSTSGIATQNLNGITCVGTNFCTVVGAAGTFGQYNGSSWSASTVTGLSTYTFNDVSCVSATDCWAVGNASGGSAIFAHWNGSSWTRNAAWVGTAPAVNMNGVYCADTNNCWAVGAGGGAFWNGNTWDAASTGLTSLTANKVNWPPGAPVDRVFGWQEMFN